MSGRSRQRRSLDTVAEVQAAATELFGLRGFAAVGMDDVAAACGRTKGAVYHHFGSKEELFEAVFSAEQRRLVEHVMAGTTSTDPVEALLEGVATYLEAIAADEAAARITLIDAPAVMGWVQWRQCEGGPFRSLLATSLGRLADAERLIGDAADGQPLVDVLLGAITEAALVIATSPEPKRAAPALVGACRSLVQGLTR